MEHTHRIRVAVGHQHTGLEPALHFPVVLVLALPHLLAVALGQFGSIYSIPCHAQ